ncbi:MAG: sporulation protein YabP [Clostridia bacterium]|nr:sporulation protein YabP [Clostridia bacterium]
MVEQNTDTQKMNQKLILEDRSRFSVGLVENVENFSEEEILLKTGLGGLLVTGRNLKMEDLSLENGSILLTGIVDRIEFSEIKEKRSFFKDLFR